MISSFAKTYWRESGDSSSVDENNDGIAKPQSMKRSGRVDELANRKEGKGIKKWQKGYPEEIPRRGNTKPRLGDDSKQGRDAGKVRREHPTNPKQESQNADEKSGGDGEQAGRGEGETIEGPRQAVRKQDPQTTDTMKGTSISDANRADHGEIETIYQVGVKRDRPGVDTDGASDSDPKEPLGGGGTAEGDLKFDNMQQVLDDIRRKCKADEARIGEMSQMLEEQRQLITRLTEEIGSLSKKSKAKEDELLRSKQDLIRTREQLQMQRDHLTQLESQGEAQRKQYERQESEMTRRFEEQRQLIAQLTEGWDSLSKKSKAKEDELSLSNRDLVSTRQQLQDLRDQLTQSQHEHEMQREHQKSEMTGKLRQLIAQIEVL